MNRDSFDADGHIKDTLGGYPQASRQIAADTKTALIDLNAMSKTMFEAMGPAGADHAFMKFKAGSYPWRQERHLRHHPLQQLRRLRTSALHRPRHPQDNLPIAKFLDPAVPDFDPAHPDAFADFHLPYTPPQQAGDVTKIPQANLK